MLGTARRAACAAPIALALIGSASAQVRTPLIDARSAIERIEGNDPEAKIERAENAFNVHLRAFAVESGSMPAAKAAAQWMAIVDEAIAVPHRSLMGAMGGAPPVPIGTLYTAVLALPGPKAWPEIRALVDKRPPSIDRTALQILCARLMGDDEAVIRLCGEYDLHAPKRTNLVFGTSPTLLVRLSALRRLGRLTGRAELEQCLSDSQELGRSVPDLRELLPDPDARAVLLVFLQKGDTNPIYNLSWQNYPLAREVVLANLSAFKKPTWGLAQDWEDLPYVQRLIQHYGYASLVDPKTGDERAQNIYFRSLVLGGKLDQAVRLVRDMANSPSISEGDWGPAARNADQIIGQIQARLPQRDLTDLFVDAAVASGHIQRAVDRVQHVIRAPSTPHDRKLRLIEQLIDLHARVGNVDGILADLRYAKTVHRAANDFEPGYNILSMGLALGDNRLIDAGIARELRGEEVRADGPLFTALAERGRLAELERIAIRSLRKHSSESNYAGWDVQSLCSIYYRANRPKDVLDLLNEFPLWPASDLSKLNSEYWRSGGEDDADESPSFYAAWAFAKTGRKELALRTLRDLLLSASHGSPPYRLLNDIGGPGALPVYADLSLARRYDAQVAVWQGDLLYRLGRIAEAETCVRRAMAIDPVGNVAYRIKLNDLLGKVLSKKGDLAGANRCAKLIRALHLAAKGQELMQVSGTVQVGFLSMAASVLRQAVEIFPDDAALQFQYADYLNKLYRFAEAETHVVKALRLVPSALGEASSDLDDHVVEAYPNETRKILDELVRRSPSNAEAYYARGSMNERLDRWKLAIADYRKTASLDPRHIGAWQGLVRLSIVGLLTPAEAQDAQFHVIDLVTFADSSRGRIDLVAVSDLGAAYERLRARMSALPVREDGVLFPLHSGDPWGRRAIDWPRLDPYRTSLRLVGEFFRDSSDLREIADLFHVTSYPFE